MTPKKVMTTTTEKECKTARQSESVIKHSSLRVGDKVQQECWAVFSGTFMTENGPAYLQPGQFIPIWRRSKNNWQAKPPFTLSVISAFVMGGRYMIRGGDNKLGSHPKITDWDDGLPVTGQAAELRFPGGIRRIHPGNQPTLIANGSNFESRNMTARAFHDNFGSAPLYEGCPIEIACRADKADEQLPYTAHVMYDILRSEATAGYALPFPIISSNEEEVVLKDYSEGWTTAMNQFCQLYDIQEIGVLYKMSPGSDDIIEDISTDRPKEVYRNALVKGDLGFSTLDPGLYERMLPFSTGEKLDVEFLPRI
jgi:hypothetical protein